MDDNDDDYDAQRDPDLRQGKITAETVVGGQKQEKLRIPPSIIKYCYRLSW